MRSYEISEAARLDFYDAFEYIAEHSYNKALLWEARLLDSLSHVAEFPMTGQERREILPAPLRCWTVEGHLVIYDPSTEPVGILAILNGRRNLEVFVQSRLARNNP